MANLTNAANQKRSYLISDLSQLLDLGPYLLFSYRCDFIAHLSWISLCETTLILKKKKKTVSCRIIKEKRKKFERSFSLPRYRKRQHRILTWYQHGIKHLLWCISESLGLLSTQRYLYRGTITWRTASWNGSMSDA